MKIIMKSIKKIINEDYFDIESSSSFATSFVSGKLNGHWFIN